MAVSTLKIMMKDGSPEGKDSTSIGGNVAPATTWANVDTFLAAIAPLQAGAGVEGASVSNALTVTTSLPVAGGENERHKRWAVRCKNSKGKKETHYIPCAKYSLITTLGVDSLDILTGAGAAAKTAFEALFKDDTGGALVVEAIYKANS
jgi:hypothetical protein